MTRVHGSLLELMVIDKALAEVTLSPQVTVYHFEKHPPFIKRVVAEKNCQSIFHSTPDSHNTECV